MSDPIRVMTYGTHGRRVRLKKDLVIPAGTIFAQGPERVEFHVDHVECLIGLTDDTTGHLIYEMNPKDLALDDWFEVVEEPQESDHV